MTTKQVAIRVKTDGKAEVKRDFAEIGQAGAGAYEQIDKGAEKATAAADRQMAAYRKLAQAAKDAEGAAAQQAKFNAMLGVGTTPKSAQESAEVFAAKKGVTLSQNMRSTAIYTASDLVSSLGSGMNPGIVALQQGPQVLQAIAMEGGNAIAVLTRLALTIGLPVAALGLLTAAWLGNEEAMRRLNISAAGLGATAGLTADQLNNIAIQAAKAGEVSVSASREMAAAYVNTGRIGGEVTSRLIALTKAYALATSQDAKAATLELGAAFADPARGAVQLNQKLNFLDDATAQYIQTLIQQNRTTEAQILLAQRLDSRLQSTAGYVSVLGNAWSTVARKASDAWSVMGQAIDRALGGGSAIDRLTDLRRNRQNLSMLSDPNSVATVAALDAKIAKIEGDLRADAAKQRAAQSNQAAQRARAALDRANPTAVTLREKQTDLATIDAAVKAGDITAAAAKAGRDALIKDIKALEAGYRSSAAQASALGRASREAEADARRAAREAAKDAKEDQRLMELKARNALEIARLRAGTRTDYDLTNQRLVVEELERQAKVQALIQDYVQAGLDKTAARVAAEKQVGDAMKAAYEGRVADISKPEEGFKSTAEWQASLKDITLAANDNSDALKAMGMAGVDAFDRIGQMIKSGASAWDDWKDAGKAAIQDILGELFQFAALNPLKNAIFGGMSGYQAAPTLKSSFLSSLFGGIGSLFNRGAGGLNLGSSLTNQGIPTSTLGQVLPNVLGAGVFNGIMVPNGGVKAYANGTDNHPGGWADVGEQGRERVWLPPGAKVLSAARTAALGDAKPVVVNITLNAQGAGPRETEALIARIDRLERDLPGTITGVVNDGLQRRTIRG